jgi:formylglycine-generating enzyme required for sulfatase activity
MRSVNLIYQICKILRPGVIACLLTLAAGCAAVGQKNTASGPVNGKSWSLSLPGNTLLPMAWIPSGTFTMGSPEDEKGRKPDEVQHRVTLTKSYWIGKTEVTARQWKAVTGMSLHDKVTRLLHDETLYDFDGKKQRIRDFMHFDQGSIDKIMANENDELPMYFVSWNEAMDFCKKLTEQEQARGNLPAGYIYTLPTEAQWEYACRAGNTGPTYASLSTGNLDQDLGPIAWYVKNSAEGYTGKGFGHPEAGPRNAGTKLPNKLGTQDMLGNLWEWCYDWYGLYTANAVTNPRGPATGSYRVNRGGSFGSGPNDERSANRAQNPPNEASAYRGFRIVLSTVQ